MIYLPKTETGVSRTWLLGQVEELHRKFTFLNSLYYLVKQGAAFGERLRCNKCGGRHDYITLNCIPRPFTGYMNGLYGYYHLVKDNDLQRSMSDGEKARYNAIVETLDSVPNLASVHPRMAKKLVEDIGPSDMKVGAVSIGVLEGISRVHALKLVQQINDRGLKPKLVLEVMNPYEKLRRELSNGQGS